MLSITRGSELREYDVHLATSYLHSLQSTGRGAFQFRGMKMQLSEDGD